MLPTQPNPLLVIFGELYAICALGLLYSRGSSRHKEVRKRKVANGIDEGARAVAEKYRAAVGAEIDATVDRLAARRGVPRDQLTRDMVDKEFRRDVRKTWSTNLAKARHPKPGYIPGAIDPPKK